MPKLLNSASWRAAYSKHRRLVWFIQGLAVFAVGFALAWSMRGPSSAGKAETPAKPSVPQAETATLWTCSMHPSIRQPQPGDCPICGMDLIPVAKTAGGLRTLSLSPEARALMNIATSPVERKYVTHTIRMVGKVDYDETKLGHITAWVGGRLDRLYVDFTGVQVREGDHMVYIYSPELYAAQEELIQAIKYQRENEPTGLVGRVNLADAARDKLRLLGLTEDQIREIEKQERPSDHLTIYSTVSGIVIEKLKQEGDYVKTGERIYTVADLGLVWVHLDAYETDLPWVRYGQDVTLTTEAYPGEEFHGRIAFIQPVLNDKTRTVKVRVNVPNADGRLKPEMFVHATVRPRVAAGGRVMDPSLADKWMCPMHPEIVKDDPGKCDNCEMPLARTESLGYVAPETDRQGPPLVVPYSAALVTGTRAVVYVELPVMHSAAEPAFQTLSDAVAEGKLESVCQAFTAFSEMLNRPYDHPADDYAKSLWDQFADELARHALTGGRAKSMDDAEQAFARLEKTMNRALEQFAPPGQPTFEGREIVLGPRAGDYYLVRRGLEQGQQVVTQGNFKIDSEIQIRAKPSMMMPEGGGDHSGHAKTLPAEFYDQIRVVDDAYDLIAEAIRQGELGQATAAFAQVGQALEKVDESRLTGHPRMLWTELAMLLANDAAEGSDARQMEDADRVFLLLKGHMRRLHDQLGIQRDMQPKVERIAVAAEFQANLTAVWQGYLNIQRRLAADDLPGARQAVVEFRSAVAKVDDSPLSDRAKQLWTKELENLGKLVEALDKAADVEAMRVEFLPLSQEIGILVKTFGIGSAGPVYELHCPMAFQGRGAIWYQDNDQVRNPYYGATMLKCADKVEEVDVGQ